MTQKILTTQDRLGQIFADNKACKNPDCACCVHWSATVYRLLTMLGTVLDTLQTTVDAKSRVLQEMADIKRRLLLCDNSITPSSQIPISEKKRGDARNDPDNVAAKKKQGAQPGHGKTAERLPAEAEEHHQCTQ